MSNFNRAFKITVGHEGGFQNDRRDRGNWTGGKIGKGELKGTNWGISAASFPALDIKNITLLQAEDIYKKIYWDAIKGDALPFHVALNVFDMAINSGITPAIKTMQRALGTLPDGIIGTHTMESAKVSDADDFADAFYKARLGYVRNLSVWNVFGFGWAKRFKAINLASRIDEDETKA